MCLHIGASASGPNPWVKVAKLDAVIAQVFQNGLQLSGYSRHDVISEVLLFSHSRLDLTVVHCKEESTTQHSHHADHPKAVERALYDFQHPLQSDEIQYPP